MNIFQDIKTAVELTGEIRKARKDGASGVQIRPVYTVPVVELKPCYMNTMEAGQTWKLGRDTDRAVMELFQRLPYETQRRLEFTPKKPGEWVERAKFWQRELEPALPTKMKHEVMMLFIGWYARCLRRRKEQTKHDAN